LQKRLKILELQLEATQEKILSYKWQKAYELMIPYSRLGAGKTFGDLAL
jgi:hypothetical protein